MSRTVTVGFDGALESRAAAARAARGAGLRGSRLLLVHLREPVAQAPPPGGETRGEKHTEVIESRRGSPLGAHTVTHAGLHHAIAPVAVVAHG